MNEHINNMKNLFNELSTGRYLLRDVFFDFLKVSAIALRNSTDHNEVLEQEYLDTMAKYSKKEAQIFPKLYAELVYALEKEGFDDVLGRVFMELDLGSACRGQFFTPFTVCVASSEILLSNIDEMLKDKNFITLMEPASGAGGMVIAAAQAMYKKNYNPQQQMLCYCTDVDINAVYMTYIQLSILGIPAVVTHGNSLTMQEWGRWETPFYQLFGWRYKEQRKRNERTCGDMPQANQNEENLSEEIAEDSVIGTSGTIVLRQIDTSILNKKSQKNVTTGQLSFCS